MKTSSLTSTKPPTAVRMPSASSANLTRLLQSTEAVRRGREAGAVGRGAEAVDQPRGGVVRVAQFAACGGELAPCIVGHVTCIGLGHAAVRPKPRHRRPFGDDRMRALERHQLLVGGGGA